MIKSILLDNYFFDLFTDVQICYWTPLKFDLGCDFRKIKIFEPKNDYFLKMELLIKLWNAKENFADNFDDNILKFSDVLPNDPFTTSQMNRYY